MRILKVFLTVVGLVLAAFAGVVAIAVVVLAAIAFFATRGIRRHGTTAAVRHARKPDDVIDITATEVPTAAPEPSPPPPPAK